MFSGFHKKSVGERRELLEDLGVFTAHDLANGGLELQNADLMIENVIGTLSLPLGVCPTLVVNGISRIVPMAVEEPSVIAAVTGICKLVAAHGGFTSKSTESIMTGQIQILDIDDIERAKRTIKNNEKRLLDLANSKFCSSMAKRGGGAREIICRVITPKERKEWKVPSRKPYIVVHVNVDVCEAMGANVVNQVAEGLGPEIAKLVKGTLGFRILTNLCDRRTVVASFGIPVKDMKWKGSNGQVVVKQMLGGFYLALDDPYRAATHNKGIMNGIDAAAVALGQDWRALEAGVHAYASRTGQYSPLTRYWVDWEEAVFHGEIEIPCSVGTKGGALTGAHRGYRAAHRLLKNPSASELSEILASVGLAQNFAALRALAVTGIQAGHMKLHSRNLVVSTGCPTLWVHRISSAIAESEISSTAAQVLLDALAAQGNNALQGNPKDWSTVFLTKTLALAYRSSEGRHYADQSLAPKVFHAILGSRAEIHTSSVHNWVQSPDQDCERLLSIAAYGLELLISEKSVSAAEEAIKIAITGAALNNIEDQQFCLLVAIFRSLLFTTGQRKGAVAKQRLIAKMEEHFKQKL